MTGTSKITEAGAALAAWTSQQEPTYPELSRNGWALYDALRALLDAVKAQAEPSAVTDEMAERAGLVLFSFEYPLDTRTALPGDWEGALFRRRARAALEAALAVSPKNDQD